MSRNKVSPFPFFAAAISLLLVGFASQASNAQTDSPFLEKPYLQLGNAPALLSSERLTLLWHTDSSEGQWLVETKVQGATTWKKENTPQQHRVTVGGIAPHSVWQATLTGLKPGTPFSYRVLKNGAPLFTATATARKATNQPTRFVVFGDCAQGTPGQRAIAYQTFLAKPDFVFITGDIVYGRGRASEYREKYFPIYNAEEASASVGAPLTRSTVFLASPGNHDILGGEFDTVPDTFAYFYYWSQPLNGPLSTIGAPNTPRFSGSDQNKNAFLSSAGDTFPKMANFSFDYGNTHWTVLDANTYVDWTDEALRAWVAKDIAYAKKATWRLVAFHQPGFNSSKSHFSEQRMRLLSDIFEKGKVDIVFTGHVHNYQRSYPLKFAVDKKDYEAARTTHKADGPIGGQWILDKKYDGERNTKPEGVLYLVTGGGGASLYNPEQQTKPETWQPFTLKFISDTHSLTLVDVKGKTMTVRQVSETGTELDKFVVTK